MNEPPYITSLEEVFWGVLLVAITMAIHGLGMVLTLRSGDWFKNRFERSFSFVGGLGLLICASWAILIVHIVEVFVWGGFFLWKGALPNLSISNYYALMEYTTLGSEYNLPLAWRLLGGMIGIAGLLTFAWSTGVLLTLAQDFQDRELQILRRHGHHPRPGRSRAPSEHSDDTR